MRLEPRWSWWIEYQKITSKFHPARYDQKLDRMVPTEENIDVIEWVPDPAEFIYNAIAPAEVDQVNL